MTQPGPSEMGDRAADLASDVGTAVKEHPYTTMAIAAGLAFAVGALWKLGHQRPRSRLDTLVEQLPELAPKETLWPRRWR
jgi:hypothetical protein